MGGDGPFWSGVGVVVAVFREWNVRRRDVEALIGLYMRVVWEGEGERGVRGEEKAYVVAFD